LEPLLLTRGKTFMGTKTFLPQPLNAKGFKNIDSEDAETQYATIGILKFIIGQ